MPRHAADLINQRRARRSRCAYRAGLTQQHAEALRQLGRAVAGERGELAVARGVARAPSRRRSIGPIPRTSNLSATRDRRGRGGPDTNAPFVDRSRTTAGKRLPIVEASASTRRNTAARFGWSFIAIWPIDSTTAGALTTRRTARRWSDIALSLSYSRSRHVLLMVESPRIAPSPAASTMPSLRTPRSVTGSRLATTMTRLPTSASGA